MSQESEVPHHGEDGDEHKDRGHHHGDHIITHSLCSKENYRLTVN